MRQSIAICKDARSLRPTGEKDQRAFNPFGPEKKFFTGQENQ